MRSARSIREGPRGPQARYQGRRKTLLQALLAANVANIGRLQVLGAWGL